MQLIDLLLFLAAVSLVAAGGMVATPLALVALSACLVGAWWLYGDGAS